MQNSNSYNTNWINQASGKDCVVLVHGLFRNQNSMSKIAKNLSAKGYNVINFGYDTWSKSIDSIAIELNAELKKLPGGYRTLNFVTHSIGTIIVRYYLAKYRPEKVKRFVMIAPPNQGSEWGVFLKKYIPFVRPLFGSLFNDFLTTFSGREFIPICEFGIIAGGTGRNMGLNPFISGDNDMTVGVDETRLTGMKDFIMIKGQHSLLLLQNDVVKNIEYFLDNGLFINTNGIKINSTLPLKP